jgi:hypothetical protein
MFLIQSDVKVNLDKRSTEKSDAVSFVDYLEITYALTSQTLVIHCTSSLGNFLSHIDGGDLSVLAI